MAILDLQALEVSSELNGHDDCHDRHDHYCGSGLSLLLCS